MRVRVRENHPIRRLNYCDVHGAVGLELAIERRGRGERYHMTEDS